MTPDFNGQIDLGDCRKTTVNESAMLGWQRTIPGSVLQKFVSGNARIISVEHVHCKFSLSRLKIY